MDLFTMFKFMAAGPQAAAPTPPAGADYVVTGNASTAGDYAEVASYTTDYGTGTGPYNGYPVCYSSTADKYLFYYFHPGGSGWCLATVVLGFAVPITDLAGTTDYCTTDNTSPTQGTWHNGSIVTAAT